MMKELCNNCAFEALRHYEYPCNKCRRMVYGQNIMFEPVKPRTYADRYIGTCAKCGKKGFKKNMSTLMIRADGLSSVRTLCHLCPDCTASLLDDLAVPMPD